MRIRLAGLVAFLAVSITACDPKQSASAAPSGGPVEVGVVTIEQKPVMLTTELPGRLSPYRVAEVRARVNGIVQKRLFEEGADVKAGDDLFFIDPGAYRAAHDSALAALSRAEANVNRAKVQADRSAQLLKEGLASKQENDDAVANLRVAEADRSAAIAAVKAAKITSTTRASTRPSPAASGARR